MAVHGRQTSLSQWEHGRNSSWLWWGHGWRWYACETKPEGVGRMSGDAGALSECDMKTLITPDHTAIQVGCSG